MSEIPASKRNEGASQPTAERVRLPLRKRLVFSLIVVVTVLLGVEVVGRVVAWVANGFNPYYLCYGFYSWSDDGGGGYTNEQRGYSKFPIHATIKHGLPEPCRINNHGMRGPDFETKKAPGTFRIVCMGASSTFGFTDRDEGTYPRLLQKLFDEDGLSPKVEVINAGVPNMRTRNILAMYENEIASYEPDLVTVYTGYNDAHEAEESRIQAVCRWLDEHSAAFAGMRKGVNMALGPVLAAWWELPHVDRESAERQARLRSGVMAANIGRLIESAQAHGTQVLLIRQPITLWPDKKARRLVSDDAPRPTYEQEYREVEGTLQSTGRLQGWEVTIYVHHAILDQIPVLANRYGLDVVDNVALVSEKPERLSTYVHLTEEGNARLAEELHKAIRAKHARK